MNEEQWRAQYATLDAAPIPEKQVSVSSSSPSPKKPLKLKMALWVGLAVLFLTAVVIIIFWLRQKAIDKTNQSKLNPVKVQEIDTASLTGAADQIKLNDKDKVVINGQLQANQGIVLSPSKQPTPQTIGQLYFDQTSKQINYFNGTGYVPFGSQTDINSLQNNFTTLQTQLSAITATLAEVSANAGKGSVTSIESLSAAVDLLGTGGLTISVSGQQISFDLPQNLTTTGSPQFTGLTLGNALAIASGGTGSTTANGALSNLGGASSGANSDITSLLGLTTALSIGQGGTGHTSFVPNGVVTTDGSGNLTTLTDVAGLCLISGIGPGGTAGFGACAGGGASVASLNGLSGALTLLNASGSGLNITIDDAAADGTTKGIASFSSTNFTDNGAGVIDTIQDINSTATPTFAGLTLTSPLDVTSGGTGAGDAATARSNLSAAKSGANSDITSLSGLTTPLSVGQGGIGLGSTPLNGQLPIGNGTAYTLATLTQGSGITITNGAGAITVTSVLGPSVDLTSEVTGILPLANGGTNAIDANGARSNLSAAKSGANADITSLTGLTTALTVGQGGIGTNSLSANQLLLGNGSAAITSLSDGGNNNYCLLSTGGGAPSFQPCPGGVTSLNGETGVLTVDNASGLAGHITIDDAAADGLTKGIATFNATNFQASSGVVNLIQDINTGATPQFTGLKLGLPASATGDIVLYNSSNPNSVTLQSGISTAPLVFTLPTADGSGGDCLTTDGSGNLSFVSCGGGGSVSSIDGETGAITIDNTTGLAGVITIDDAKADGATKGIASFNATDFVDNLGVIDTVQAIDQTATPTFAGLNTNNITPSASLTIGSVGQSFTLQGTDTSVITASNSGFKTTVGFTGTASGNVDYTFNLAEIPGTYTICTDAPNSGCLAKNSNSTYIQFAPAVAQPDNSSNSTIFVNKISGTGNILQLQDQGVDAFVLQNNGDLLFHSFQESSSALEIQNSHGTNVFQIDTTSNPNLIANGDFETDISGWFGWDSPTVFAQYVLDGAPPSSSSLEVVNHNSAAQGGYYPVALTPGQQYTFSISAHKLNTKTSSLSIGWYEGSDPFTGTRHVYINKMLLDSQAWNNLSFTFTASGAPSGVYFLASTNGTDYVVDQASLAVGLPGDQRESVISTFAPLVVKPAATTSALQVLDANSNAVFVVDNLNGKTTVSASSDGDGVGIFRITNKDGAGIFNVNASDAGSLQDWTASNYSLPAKKGETQTTTVTTVNGKTYMYAIGGVTTPGTTETNTAYYAEIIGGTTGPWIATRSLPANRAMSGVVSAKGYIYVLGGWNGTIGTDLSTAKTVFYAKVNQSDGSLGAWTQLGDMQAPHERFQAVTYGGYIYAIGGSYHDVTNMLPNVTYPNFMEYAKVNSDGTLGAWTYGPNLPGNVKNTRSAITVTTNGVIYIAGGFDGSQLSTVYYAPIVGPNGAVGTWTQDSNSLPVSRVEATANADNGYLYIVGGTSSADPDSKFYYAPIIDSINGGLSSWSSSPLLYPVTGGYLPLYRAFHGSVLYNHHIFIIGGRAKGNNAWQTSVYSASTSGASSVVAVQGALQVTNGETLQGDLIVTNSLGSESTLQVVDASGATVFNVDTKNSNVSLNASSDIAHRSGPAEIHNWTTAERTLPTPTAGSGAAIVNGYLYTISGGSSPSVSYAKLGSDGSIGTWTATTALPDYKNQASVIAYNGYIYVIGGYDSLSGASATGTIYFGKPGSDGTIANWQTASSTLLTGVASAGVSVANGYIYLSGGATSSSLGIPSSPTDKVQFARLKADGSLGSFSYASNILLAKKMGARTVVVANNLYLLGGADDITGAASKKVYYAALNAQTGDMGVWTPNAVDMPEARAYQFSYTSSGYLYAVGGTTTTYAAGNSSSVIYGHIDSTGPSITNWFNPIDEGLVLPEDISDAPGAVVNGFVYILGGAPATADINYGSMARAAIGGSIDLVGTSGLSLSDTGAGGTLTAGNTTIVGTLDVRDSAVFSQSLSVDNSFVARSDVLLQNTTDSTSALLVNNSFGKRILGIDTQNGLIELGTPGPVGGLTGTLQFYNAGSSFSGSLQGANYTSDRSYTLPDADGTICLDSGNCGDKLQDAYTKSTGGTTPEIKTDATRGSLDVQDADVTIAGNLFTVRGSNNSGLGQILFGVDSTGAAVVDTSLTTPSILSTGTFDLTPAGAATIGSKGQSLTLQGNGATTLTATSGLNTTSLAFQSPTGVQILTLPDTAGVDDTICLLTLGNCAGAGTGVTTPGGTSGKFAIFTGTSPSQTIDNSTLSESSGVVTASGSFVIQGSGGLTLGTAGPAGATGKIVFNNATNSNTVTLQSGVTGGTSPVFTLPIVDGSGGQCLTTNGSGSLSFVNCVGGGGAGGNAVTALNTFINSVSIVGTTDQVNVNNSSNTITLSTPQSIATTSSVTFNGITANGTITANGDLNVGNATTDRATITSQLLGATPLVFQGATDNAFTTTLSITDPTGNNTITLPNETGTICTSGSICSGYASNALNNLSSVAINTSLLPSADNAANRDIGSGTFRFQSGYFGTSLQSPVLQTADGATTSVGIVVRSGDTTGGSGLSTGGLIIKSGDGTGTNTSTGNISIDSGSKSGSGTAGTLTFGGTNASALTLGRSALQISIPGGLTTVGSAITTAGGGISTNGGALSLTNGNITTTGTIASGTINSQTISSTANFTGTVAIQGSNALTLGTSTSSNGAIVFNTAGAGGNTITLVAPGAIATSSKTITLPDYTGTVCLDIGGGASNCNGAGATLQTAYTNSTGGTTSEIILDSTVASRTALDIQDRSTSNGGTVGTNILNVRATAATDATAGAVLFGVGNTGATLFQNSADSTAALEVKNLAGTSIFVVDTTNSKIGTKNTTSGSTNSATLTIKSGDATGSTSNSGNVLLDVGTATGTKGSITIGGTNATSVTIGNSGNTTAIPSVLQATNTASFQANNAAAFVVQKSAGNKTINVDTTASSSSLVNVSGTGSFEGTGAGATTGWAGSTVSPVATLSAVSTQHLFGAWSLQVVTSVAANAKAFYNYTFSATTTYTLSVYLRGSTSFSTINIGRQDQSGSDIDCLTSQTVSTSGWTRFSCSFTTGGTISSSNIYIKDTSVGHTFFVDGVQLEASSNLNIYSDVGQVDLYGTISSQLAIRPVQDSTTAFLIQSSNDNVLLTADSLNRTILVGTPTSNRLASLNLYAATAQVTGTTVIGAYVSSSCTSTASGNGYVLFDSGASNPFEPLLCGSARHTKTVAVAPEYAGAVLYGDGSNNTGTMTTAFDSTNYHSYYNWSTTGSAQDFDIWVRVPVPQDYSALTVSQSYCLQEQLSDYTSPSPRIYTVMYDSNNSAQTVANSGDGDNTTITSNNWQSVCSSNIGGTITAGGFITFRIRLRTSTGYTARVGELTFNYLSRY